MQESTNREKVLKKIRAALIAKTPNPYPNLDFESPVYRMTDEVPELVFAQAFREAGGQFVFCSDKIEFAEALLNLAQSREWKQLLCVEDKLYSFLNQCEFPLTQNRNEIDDSNAAVTFCECLVARTGSIMISSAQASGRVIPLFTRAHVVVAFPDQIVDDLKDAMQWIKSKYQQSLPSSSTFITGPSRTSGIDGEIVTGAQGPAEVYLFLIDQPF